MRKKLEFVIATLEKLEEAQRINEVPRTIEVTRSLKIVTQLYVMLSLIENVFQIGQYNEDHSEG